MRQTKGLTEKQALFLTDIFCFVIVCGIIAGLMYLTALTILLL